MAKFRTYYDNLNVSRNAPVSVIKAAYKALCQKYHPDKYIGGHEEALRIMKSINSAYAVLSDSSKRAAHDQWIARQEKEHATGEAQRIMDIISKNYTAPSVTAKNNPFGSFWAMPAKFWKIASSIGNQARFSNAQISKKLHWVLWFAGAVAFTATILYVSDLKIPTLIPAPVNQEVEAILKKARQLVKQGQVAKA